MIPVLGFMAQQHHAHFESAPHELASHLLAHEHTHSDDPHSHDHKPIDVFLQLAATALVRSGTDSGSNDRRLESDAFIASLLPDARHHVSVRVLPHLIAAPHISAQAELLRHSANLPPPVYI